MAGDFKLDLRPLKQLIERSPEAAGRGAKNALTDIKNDWVREARDIAPLKTGNLRRQIHGNVQGSGIGSYVEVEANAFSDTGGRRFNYAWWLHEEVSNVNLSTPGTDNKFLDSSAEKRKSDYAKWLEEEIKSELKKAGW